MTSTHLLGGCRCAECAPSDGHRAAVQQAEALRAGSRAPSIIGGTCTACTLKGVQKGSQCHAKKARMGSPRSSESGGGLSVSDGCRPFGPRVRVFCNGPL